MSGKNVYVEYYEDKEFLTNSMLKDFQKCPIYYRDKYILGTVEDEEKDAYNFGSAVDCLITEGEAEFNENFEVVARRSKDKTDKIQLTNSQYENIIECVNELKRQTLFKVFDFEKNAGQSVFKEVIDGIKRKGRLDYVDLENKIIMDLKTTADIYDFIESFKKYGYDKQLAGYRELVATQTKTNPEDWDCYLMVVDKNSSKKRSRFYVIDKGMLRVAEMKNKQEFKELDLAVRTGIFDHRDEEYDDNKFICDKYDGCPLSLQREFLKIY